MKALSIQQPWGTLIACGLKDVENRKWALKKLPVRVLLHTGARRQPFTDANMPYPYYWDIENYQKAGILPPLEKMPVSALVGVATIAACETDSLSMWAGRGPGAEYQWVMKDVRMFKKPVLGVKGMLGLFDVPGIDESNLPECIDIGQPRRDGRTLTLPLCARLYDEIESGERDHIEWNVVDANIAAFADGSLRALPTDRLVVTHGGRSLELDVRSYGVRQVRDRSGAPFTDTDGFGRVYEWWEACIEFD